MFCHLVNETKDACRVGLVRLTGQYTCFCCTTVQLGWTLCFNLVPQGNLIVRTYSMEHICHCWLTSTHLVQTESQLKGHITNNLSEENAPSTQTLLRIRENMQESTLKYFHCITSFKDKRNPGALFLILCSKWLRNNCWGTQILTSSCCWKTTEKQFHLFHARSARQLND